MADLIKVLTEAQEGRLIAEAGQKLTDLVRRISDLGGKGKLTLSISLTGGKLIQAGYRQIGATFDITAAEPKEPAETITMYTTPDGRLTVRHPKQLALEFSDDPHPARKE